MQRLEVSGAVRPIYGSSGVKRLRMVADIHLLCCTPSSNPSEGTLAYEAICSLGAHVNRAQRTHYNFHTT